MELLLVLYLLSGNIKAFAHFGGINFPIDLTIMFGGLSLLALLYRNVNNWHLYCQIQKKRVFYSFILFWIWMACSLIYTSSTSYSYEKVILFLTNLIPFFIILISKELYINKIIKSFVVLTILLSIMYFPLLNYSMLFSIDEELQEIVGSLYLSLGTNLGASVLLLLSTNISVFNYTVDKLLAIITFFMLLIIGARGPLIFTIICVLLYWIKNRKQIALKTLIAYLSVLLVCVVIFSNIFLVEGSSTSALYERSMERLSLIFDGLQDDGDMGDSANARVEHIENSLNMITGSIGNFIYGTGIGSYMKETTGADKRGYPHNIVLEIWSELGFIGVLLFFYFSYMIIKGKNNQSLWISGYVVLYFLLNYAKSNSLVDIRIGVTFLLLFIYSPRLKYLR